MFTTGIMIVKVMTLVAFMIAGGLVLLEVLMRQFARKWEDEDGSSHLKVVARNEKQ